MLRALVAASLFSVAGAAATPADAPAVNQGLLDESVVDAAAASSVDGAVVAQSSCKLTTAEGAEFDFSGMRRADHDYTGTVPGGYAYRFNVCGNTVKECGTQPSPASKWRGTKCNNLGDASSQKISLVDPDDVTAGLKVSFVNGDICKKQVNGAMEVSSRNVDFEIHCDRSEPTGKLRDIEEVSMCEYIIHFGSVHGCAVGSGGSGASLSFYIIFTIAMYLGVGVAYNHYQLEVPLGKEAIPHVAFWETVPGLVQEGCAFSYHQAATTYKLAKEMYDERYTPIPIVAAGGPQQA